MPGLYFACAQDDLNMRTLHLCIIEGTFTHDTAQNTSVVTIAVVHTGITCKVLIESQQVYYKAIF